MWGLGRGLWFGGAEQVRLGRLLRPRAVVLSYRGRCWGGRWPDHWMANRRIRRWSCRGFWGTSRCCCYALVQSGDSPLFRVLRDGGLAKGTAKATVPLPGPPLHHPPAGLRVTTPLI